MSPHQLTRTLELLKDVDFMLEQPCPTMNSCDQVCKQVQTDHDFFKFLITHTGGGSDCLLTFAIMSRNSNTIHFLGADVDKVSCSLFPVISKQSYLLQRQVSCSSDKQFIFLLWDNMVK